MAPSSPLWNFNSTGPCVATGFFLSHHWEFPPFLLWTEPMLPHHQASLSSFCPLAHTFQTKLLGGPNSHKHPFCLSMGTRLEIPQFWGSVPPWVGGTPPGSIPADAATSQHFLPHLPLSSDTDTNTLRPQGIDKN